MFQSAPLTKLSLVGEKA